MRVIATEQREVCLSDDVVTKIVCDEIRRRIFGDASFYVVMPTAVGRRPIVQFQEDLGYGLGETCTVRLATDLDLAANKVLASIMAENSVSPSPAQAPDAGTITDPAKVELADSSCEPLKFYRTFEHSTTPRDIDSSCGPDEGSDDMFYSDISYLTRF